MAQTAQLYTSLFCSGCVHSPSFFPPHSVFHASMKSNLKPVVHVPTVNVYSLSLCLLLCLSTCSPVLSLSLFLSPSAVSLPQDLCFLTNGDPPAWLPNTLELELSLGLELLETVLREYPLTFMKVGAHSHTLIHPFSHAQSPIHTCGCVALPCCLFDRACFFLSFFLHLSNVCLSHISHPTGEAIQSSSDGEDLPPHYQALFSEQQVPPLPTRKRRLP